MTGKLITLEGIDGAGKSTITDFLKSLIAFEDVLFTREPTNSWMGQAVDRAIREDTDHLAELFLFTADHAHHISSLIDPALKKGQHVISDRYSDSRYAYQAVTLKGRFDDPLEWVRTIHRGWTIVPDLTILFDIDPAVAVQRCGKRGEQTKFEKIEFLEAVRRNYLSIAREEKERFFIIDADRDPDKIKIDVMEAIASITGIPVDDPDVV